MADDRGQVASGELFGEGFLKRIEQLVVAGRKLYAGSTSGQRRSTRIGDGVEFADHRAYFPGDDPRYIDWNVYARTERLLLRLFHEEADLLVHVVVDASASMSLGGGRGGRGGNHPRPALCLQGRGVASKFDHARRIAAALGHMALANLDRVAVWTAGDGGGRRLGPLRGMGQRNRLLETLAGLETKGRADLSAAAEEMAARRAGRGVAILIGDFCDGDMDDLARAIDRLRFAGIDVSAIQVLAPEEIGPPYRGRVDLTDVETAATRRVQVTADLRAAYLAELAERFEALERLAAARETPLVRTITTDPFDSLVLRTFRLAGLVE